MTSLRSSSTDDAPRFDALVAAGVVALGVAAAAAFHGLRHDDAFITFRYAANLARGLGPVFNPGERILGTTAPGHMLLAALAYLLVGKAALPSAMSILGCLGWSAQALAAFSIFRTFCSPRVSAATALVLALGAVGSAGVVALETNLVAASVLIAFAFALRSRWTAAAAASAIAGLLRPDAYLVVLLLGAACALATRRFPLRPALTVAAITLPWQTFATWYYGSPFPQSATAKVGRTAVADYLGHELSFVSEVLLHSSSWPAVMLTFAAAIAGAVALLERDRKLWVIPAWGVLHLLAYAWLRPFRQHTWQLYPLCLVAFLLIAAALAWLWNRGARAPRALAAVLAGALAVSSAVSTASLASSYPTDFWYGARDRAYTEASQYLAGLARSTDVVAAVEVGTVGYLTDLPMYDWGGLITRAPVPNPRDRKIVWAVLDPSFAEVARHTPPVRTWNPHGFEVRVYNSEWTEEAIRSVQARLGSGVSRQQVRERHEREVAEALEAIARAREAAAAGH